MPELPTSNITDPAKAPTELAPQKRDLPASDKRWRHINSLANNPGFTLAVGLVLAGLGTVFNPNKKWFKSGFLARMPKFMGLNWPLGGLITYVGIITGTQIHHIKETYRAAVAIELNKKDTDVTYTDLLFRTKNTVVQNTWKEFRWRILGRSAALGTPLIPWLAGHKDSPHPSIMSGATAIESGIEKLNPTVWDKFVDISTVQKEPGDDTTASEIKNILAAHRKRMCKSKNIPCLIPAPGTPEAHSEDILASYIAALLDENRKRFESVASQTGSGYFKVSTFVYLMGNNAEGTDKSFLEQKFPVNLAYVLLATQDDAQLTNVKRTAADIAAGKNPVDVFYRYKINLNELAQNNAVNALKPETGLVAGTLLPEQSIPAGAPLLPKTQMDYVQEAGLREQNPQACQSCSN